MSQSNYGLTSPHNINYIFTLKSPQLIANNDNHFEETRALITFDQEPLLAPMTYYYLEYSVVDAKKSIIKVKKAVALGTIGGEWGSEMFLNHMKSFQGSLKQPTKNN